MLNAIKRVDSGGRALNNIGGQLEMGSEARQAFINRHRFHIAFENKRWHGYVTEKLPAAMAAGAIPIYWGCSDIDREFNPKSFFDVSRFRTFDEAAQHVVGIERERDKMAKILREPWFHDNKPNAAYDVARLGEWLHWAINQGQQHKRNLFPGDVLYKRYEKLRVRLAGQLCRWKMG